MSHMPATGDVTGSGGADTVTLLNADSVTLPVGTPVYASGAGQIKRAKANNLATATAIGVVASNIAPGASGPVIAGAEVLTATTAEWDAVAGTSGGLAFGTIYYLSPTTAGHITDTVPSSAGQFETPVGVAISPTQLSVRLEDPRAATVVASRRLIVVAGQSNAIGQEYTGNITEAQRAHIGDAYANVKMRMKGAQNAAPTVPIVWTTDTTGTLQGYTSSINNNSGHGIDGHGLGPFQSLMRHLDYYAPNTSDVLVFGQSGADLNNHWKVGGTYPAAGAGNLYNLLLAEIEATKTTFGANMGAFVWIQGYTDSTDATSAGNYQANLTALFTDVRARYPGVPLVIVKLSSATNGAQKATVRTAQVNVAGAFSNCSIVDTDDLTYPDGAHPNADGYAAIGDRIGYAVKQLLGLASPVSWTIDPYMLVGCPATEAELNAVLTTAGLANVASCAIYNCQEAAGNLADSSTAGVFGMTKAGAGGALYQRSNIYWNRKFLEIDPAVAGGNDWFTTTDAALPDPATTSQLRLMYTYIVPAAAAANLWIIGTAGFSALARDASGNAWQLSDGGNTVGDATNVVLSTRPFVEVRKRTAVAAVNGYTDNAHITGTIGAVTGKRNTIGSGGLAPNPHFATPYVLDIYGVQAELTTAQVKTLLQTLNWGNANLGATPIPW